MTGEDTVGAAPADAAQKAQDEALPAEGTDKNPGDATEQLPDSVTSPLRSAPNNPMSTLTNTYSWVQDKDESLSS